MAESIQQKGIDGADLAKRFLESTTWIELPFDAYHNGRVCTLDRLDGKKKRYDLMGTLYVDPAVPLYVEVKNADDVGKQPAQYLEFLANAYSITAYDIEDYEDAKREFMWFTKHPFDLANWSTNTKPSRIKAALDAHPDALHGKPVDADILNMVAERVWLVVFHERQNRLALSPEELSIVESKLNRKRKQ
jgi:hypothetical protein